MLVILCRSKRGKNRSYREDRALLPLIKQGSTKRLENVLICAHEAAYVFDHGNEGARVVRRLI